MLTDLTALRQHVRALGRRGSAGYPPELRGRLIAAARELRAARCSWETVADNLGVSVGYIRTKALEELADIRLGSGYQDRSADLNRLEALYIQHEAKLIQDRRYRPTDAADARRIATELLDAITNGESPEVRRLKDEASVVLGYLIEQYDELAAAGRFVLRKAGGAARLPSLRALSLG